MWHYILCGGVTGLGCGGFRGGLCANQLMSVSFYSHKKTWKVPGYLYCILVPTPMPCFKGLESGM